MDRTDKFALEGTISAILFEIANGRTSWKVIAWIWLVSAALTLLCVFLEWLKRRLV